MKKIICMLTVLLCSVMNLSAQNYDFCRMKMKQRRSSFCSKATN